MDNRPIVYRDVYKDVDRWVYRASAIGRSLRCLTLARRGYTPLEAPSYLAAAADAGNRYEDIAKAKLRADGYTIGQEQRLVEIPVGDTALIRGHLDAGYMAPGHMEVGAEPFMLEIKSMSDRVFTKWKNNWFEGFPTYGAQLSAYMYGTGRPAFYVVINRDTEEIIINAFAEPPVPFAEIEAKILSVEESANGDILPECSGMAYYCPYEYLCDRREINFEEVESGTETMLIRLADEYQENRAAGEEVDARRKEIRGEILTAMGDRKKVRAGNHKITVSEVHSKKMDMRALKEFLSVHGRTIEDFQDESVYSRLTVK